MFARVITAQAGVEGLDSEVTGDEPLTNGMLITVRMRRDFVVADAERFLRAARRAYIETTGASEANAAEVVTSATDAMFALIVGADMILDDFVESATDGLTIGGQATQVTTGKDQPLPAGRCWFGVGVGDVFASPPDTP